MAKNSRPAGGQRGNTRPPGGSARPKKRERMSNAELNRLADQARNNKPSAPDHPVTSTKKPASGANKSPQSAPAANTMTRNEVKAAARMEKRKKKNQYKRKSSKFSRAMSRAGISLFVFSIVMVFVVGLFMRNLAAEGSVEWNTFGEDISTGDLPAVSTMLDAQGNTIASFYDQNRHEVGFDQIADSMKVAIVEIEDERFYDHMGVDLRGLLRSAVNNATTDSTQGASTLSMQLAKNHRWLIRANTDEEREAAIAATPDRKVRDILTAIQLDKELSKDEILTRYLNIAPFGQGAHGIQAASQTFFGVNADQLELHQSALLAGMVQSPEYNDPWNYPDNALDRRNTVLGTMRGSWPDEDIDAALNMDLGVLEVPNRTARGCTGADAEIQAGFFCQYVVSHLVNNGIREDDLINGGYTVETTLDPQMQRSTLDAVRSTTNPQEPNVQTVASFVAPNEQRPVQAMVSSRVYGVDEELEETTMGTPFTNVGSGAGSVFKVFTAATYLQEGGRVDDLLDNPPSTVEHGIGGGDQGWSVSNLGETPGRMTLQDGLAQSPNTLFAKLIGRTGVDSAVNTSVSLGLRSYLSPDYEGSTPIHQSVIEGNQGSYTLGVTPVNSLEMANSIATIGDNGQWCQPNPVVSIRDRHGEEIPLENPPCEQVMSPDAAGELATAMEQDFVDGTAAAGARAEGFSEIASGKTGTTDSSWSQSFLGLIRGDNPTAGFVYTFSDKENSPLCWTGTNTISCSQGSAFGGQGPLTVWLRSVMNR